ncbi:MAG: non-ribosomal peptide synthetase, partial [Candidatus Methanomethylophilaceae archaeon]|nr:non-ribosomal peptide synthetase [Candidatus Methanomethylophilaceae archaeon]
AVILRPGYAFNASFMITSAPACEQLLNTAIPPSVSKIRLCSCLKSSGIKTGDRVAILVPRSEWYPLCALGVMKTGAAYVPMDTDHPDERISLMISDSASKAVLVTGDTYARCSGLAKTEIIDCTLCPFTEKVKPVLDPGLPMVVLYTSGTTGKPKGAVLTRKAIGNLSQWYAETSGMTCSDITGLHTSYSFDMHAVALYPPVLAGASTDIIPGEIRLDLDALDGYVRSRGITNMFITTQLGKMFAEKRCLKFLCVAGEKLGEFRVPDHTAIIDAYGPTENHVSTYTYVTDRICPYSVGKLLPNMKAYILDAEKRRVPYGAVGELHLSGYQLSLGYLNNEKLNSEVFLKNPFSSEPGYERMYATGDFFRLLPDGTLGVIGRRDGQVKIRGNRVELTEVESAIREMEGIENVTVQAVSNGSGKELCAYIVGDAGAESVREWVSGRKPAYMVPAFIVKLDSIPLNINGKVDRKALPVPDLSSLRSEYAAPRNETEEILCGIFENILKVDKIGIDDDFIRLGGDSLKAIRALAEVRRALPGLDITPADLMRFHTPRSISDNARKVAGMECMYSFETGCPLPDAMRNLYEIIKERPDQDYNRAFMLSLDSWENAEDALSVVKSILKTYPVFDAKITEIDGIPWLDFSGNASVKIIKDDPDKSFFISTSAYF